GSRLTSIGRSWGLGCSGGSRTSNPDTLEQQLRGEDSNLRLPVQSRASLPLDYPAVNRSTESRTTEWPSPISARGASIASLHRPSRRTCSTPNRPGRQPAIASIYTGRLGRRQKVALTAAGILGPCAFSA